MYKQNIKFLRRRFLSGPIYSKSITDFNAGTATTTIDQIDLSGIINGAAFSYIGEVAFSAVAGVAEARFDTATSTLQIDTAGSGAADMEVTMTNVTSTDLDNNDFITAVI